MSSDVRKTYKLNDNYDRTVGEFRERITYDPNSGIFHWKVTSGKARAGKAAGFFEHGYWCIGIFSRTHTASRLAWLLTYEEWPAGLVDHINGDPLDNRIANLRLVTPSQNQANRRTNKCKKSSSYKGVFWNRACQKWFASIMQDGKHIYLGIHSSEEEARRAYESAADSFQGSYAHHKCAPPVATGRAAA